MPDDLTQKQNSDDTQNQPRAPRPLISVEEIEKAIAQAREKAKAEEIEQTVEPQTPTEATNITQEQNIPETTAVAVSSVKQNIENISRDREPKPEPRVQIREEGIPETTPIAVSSIKESLASISRTRQETVKEVPPQQEQHRTSIVRTFKTDIAEAVRENNMSLAGVAIKEDEKRREEAGVAVHASRTNKLLVLASAALVIAGLLVVIYVLFVRRDKNLPTNTPQVASIIFTDTTQDIDTTGMSFKELREKVVAQITGDRLRVGTIKNLRFINTRFIEQEGEEVSERYWIPAQELFTRLSIPARSTFTRQLAPEFFYGIYSFKGQSGFIILQTKDYASMFAQLLGYEDTLARDLYPLLTGQDTPNIQDRVWGDEVIDNLDTRMLRTASGDLVMLWSFVGTRDTVLIATDGDVFREVVERIQTPRRPQ